MQTPEYGKGRAGHAASQTDADIQHYSGDRQSGKPLGASGGTSPLASVADVPAELRSALSRIKHGAVDYDASVARIASDSAINMTLGACRYFVDLWMPNGAPAVVEQHVKELAKTLGLPDAMPEKRSLASSNGASKNGNGAAHRDDGGESADLGLDEPLPHDLPTMTPPDTVVDADDPKLSDHEVSFEIVSFTKSGGLLTKRISLDKNGKLQNDSSACRMWEGDAHRIHFDSLAEFGRFVGDLKSNEAIALGRLRDDLPDEVRLTTKNKLNGGAPGGIARTDKYVSYRRGQAALALIDFDRKGMPRDVASKLTAAGGFWAALCSVLTALDAVGRVTRTSTSSGLFRSDTGEKLAGSGGEHAFVGVCDGGDVERFIKTLHARCWLAGFGWMMVGEAGQLLERSLVDASVGNPARLVFEGAPVLEPPLMQELDARRPVVVDGGLLDTAAMCVPLTDAETRKFAELKNNEKRRLAPAAATVKAAYIEDRAQDLVKRKPGMTLDAARKEIERQYDGLLSSDIVLLFDDPELVGKTVGDVLADPERFVGETLADPLAGVEYGQGKAKILRRPNGELFINSFAHGGTTYKLRSDESNSANEQPKGNKADSDEPPVIQIMAGKLSTSATKAEEALLQSGVPLYHQRVGVGILVRPIIETVDASQGRKTKVAQLVQIEGIYMRDLLSRVASWTRYDKKEKTWLPINPPPEIAATVLARVGEWRFPIIAGVISTPTMRPDGSLLIEAGYDPQTRLLLVEPPPLPSIPDKPTRDDALAALKLLNGLLDEFPLVDDTAKAVALSLLITPVVRGAFPVAPMHVLGAPVASSGKSFLLDTAAAIAIGQLMPVISAGRNEEETEKRLGAAVRTGQPLITIDNVNGELSGDALCEIIERPRPQIRILGRSELISVEARGLTLFANGNNIVIVGDLCRRVIYARLDPQMERPELRQFKANPVEKILADRGAYIAAALTICRAYIAAGRPNLTPRLASFEPWSDTVRSALIWLGEGDCVKSMDTTRADDPDRAMLSDFLAAWAKAVGIGWEHRTSLRDLIKLSASTHQGSPDHGQLVWPDLYAVVRAVAEVRGQLDVRVLGLWARSRKDRVVNGKRLMNKPDAKGGATWWAENVEMGSSEGGGIDKASVERSPDPYGELPL